MSVTRLLLIGVGFLAIMALAIYLIYCGENWLLDTAGFPR